MSYSDKLKPQNAVLRAPLDASSGALSAGNRASSEALAEGDLETIAKFVRQNECSDSPETKKNLKETKNYGRQDGRSMRFRHQRFAAKLVAPMFKKRGARNRLATCRWRVARVEGGVDLVTNTYADQRGRRAHYDGVQSCGSVWLCPCCSARISETRRQELSHLLRWGRSQRLRIKMLTLTARHGREDKLSELVKGMKDAKRRFARHRSYEAIKPLIRGHVTAMEVTGGGQNGWHPHYHMIILTDEDVDWEPIKGAWLASLRGAGLDGSGAGWDVRDASEIGAYIAKWGAAEELTLQGKKKGRKGGGMTPAQLLQAACDDGDSLAALLWSEYAENFHRTQQLRWSQGLKAEIGLKEKTDQEAADDEKQDGQVEEDRANIATPDWYEQVAAGKVDRRAFVLDRAEKLGAAVVAAEIAEKRLPSDQEAEVEELLNLLDLDLDVDEANVSEAEEPEQEDLFSDALLKELIATPVQRSRDPDADARVQAHEDMLMKLGLLDDGLDRPPLPIDHPSHSPAKGVMPGGGIQSATRGFSIDCSTPEPSGIPSECPDSGG